jgi:hypothetical protein
MRTIAAALVALTLVAACDRKPRPAADSTHVGPPAAAPDTPAASTGAVSRWDSEAGTALLVPGEDGAVFVVVPGESAEGSSTDRTAGSATDVLPADVALFARSGAVGRAKAVPAASAANSCDWPSARLGPASGADVLPSWTIGFVGGAPAPIALDSIESASAADSATLAATVTRLAGTLPDDTVRAFHGVPFTVRSAYRFPIGDSREGLAAVLTRALNQEASPLSERVLLVAERPRPSAGASAAPWLVAYHERVAGREDEVPATEILAAVAIGPTRRPTLLLARSLTNGSQYALLERTGDLAWRARWTSAVRGC